MLKAIKILLNPNKEQVNYINNLLGSYRFVYNKCLALKIDSYNTEQKTLSRYDLQHYFHNELTKNSEYNWLNEHNTKVLKHSLINLDNAYKKFFKENKGFPKYKSKRDNILSCTFPLEAISKRNIFLDKKITLTKQLQDIKFRTSKEYVDILNAHKSNIRSATLSKTKTGKYFLSILIDIPNTKILPKTKNIVGIDVGIKDFVVTSDGEVFKNIKIKRNNQKNLSRLHRNLSKKQKNSKNKNKSRIKLAKKYEKLNNIKENYLHNITNSLLNENQVIVMEDLNIKGMLKNHKLAKSIQELSLYRFKTILKYKANWYNRNIIEIDRYFPSSKLCNVCSHKNEDLSLKDRQWTCKSCNAHHNRDFNASLNIKNEGQRLLKIGIRSPKLTLLEIS